MKWSIGVMAAVVTAASALLAAPIGTAKDGDVLVAGSCTRAATSKLRLSEEDGRIEVELEVEQNRNGVRWSVVLSHNGTRVARLTRVTRRPSGSFEARIAAPNRAGLDRFQARATSPTREVCFARASF